MRCKICGYEIDENKKTETCKYCMESGCKLARYPNCGYENIPESKTDFKIVDFLKKKLKIKQSVLNEVLFKSEQIWKVKVLKTLLPKDILNLL